ncbi:hypothetical protein MAQ5080_02060 [Marinomonas aquimarina]|uniref:Uncharacterized protein n=1 Tax=Marinomonas aquimarina TaxID=295068 RepID=A0A1A8TI08_9GAMM|nr:hypothetical protein [Marinomonas aquimarina]SBS31765.1 hypothetical protein MAQ5080_02060 [Marinomonas aquimarina]
MEKGILWLLLEAATIMTVAALWFIWRGVVLYKKAPKKGHDGDTENTSSTSPAAAAAAADDNEPPPFKALAQELEGQAHQTADILKSNRDSDDLDQITRLKLWGTLVKAERAILLNEESKRPKPILNRFMASIITSLEKVKSRNLSQHSLSKTLQDIDEEFVQASELLISKEELMYNQRELHQELHESIDHAKQKLNKLKVKENELERLKLELEKQRQQIHKLEHHDSHSAGPFASHTPQEQDTEPHYSTRHLYQLERLSKRQQAIIEHLQAQLKDSESELGQQQEQDAQQIALSRMERLSQESTSLITQLQTELDNANVDIDTLKQDISEQELQLKAMDAQIKAAEGGLLGEFQTLTSNKRDTLEALLDDFASIKPDDKEQVEPFSHQEKEVLNLEQILKESETCVQLLAQELESAEAENNSLRAQIEQELKGKGRAQAQEMGELNALREENQDLVTEVRDLKDQIVNQVSESNEKTLRNEYNKKSLELDRLQLAYSDLERKYLGTLR